MDQEPKPITKKSPVPGQTSKSLKIAKESDSKPLYNPIKYTLTAIIEPSMNSNDALSLNTPNFNQDLSEFNYIFHKIQNFSPSDLGWRQLTPIGAGLKNTANNCYLNCVLQI
jgi:ubiquitin C-terminal hydrolase